MPKRAHSTPMSLEATTVYLLPDHQLGLEELRLNLRRRGLRVTKSQLVRLAIRQLQTLPLAELIEQVTAEAVA